MEDSPAAWRILKGHLAAEAAIIDQEQTEKDELLRELAPAAPAAVRPSSAPDSETLSDLLRSEPEEKLTCHVKGNLGSFVQFSWEVALRVPMDATVLILKETICRHMAISVPSQSVLDPKGKELPNEQRLELLARPTKDVIADNVARNPDLFPDLNPHLHKPPPPKKEGAFGSTRPPKEDMIQWRKEYLASCDELLDKRLAIRPLDKHLKQFKFTEGCLKCKMLEENDQRPEKLAMLKQNDHSQHCKERIHKEVLRTEALIVPSSDAEVENTGMTVELEVIRKGFIEKAGENMLKAVRKGDEAEVHRALMIPGDPNFADENTGEAPAHIVASQGKQALLSTLLDAMADMQQQASDGRQPLHFAAEHGCLEVATFLVEKKVARGKPANDGQTPLHWAARGNHQAIIRLLASGFHTADVDAIADGGYTPLHVACKYGNVEAVQTLLVCNADIRDMTKEEETPLHFAAATGNLELVRLLCVAQCDMDAQMNGGWAPLHIAASGGHYDVARFFFKSGADKYLKMHGDSNPCHVAAAGGHARIVKLYCEYGIHRDLMMKGGVTPLHLACHAGYLEVAQLLRAGDDKQAANRNKSRDDGATPIYLATLENHSDLVRFLVRDGVVIEKENNMGMTPVHVAAMNGNVDILTHLVEDEKAMAEVNMLTYNKDGARSPLCAAVDAGQVETTRYLCSVPKVKKDLADNLGRTPLLKAALHNRPDLVRVLCNAGVATNLPMQGGWVPLHVAAHQDLAEVAEILCAAGASLDCKTSGEPGMTPAQLAVQVGNAATLRVLIDARCDVDACDEEGSTLASAAAHHGHADILQLLIASRCAVNKTIPSGFSPLTIAAYIGHYEAFKVLLEAGADSTLAVPPNDDEPYATVGGTVAEILQEQAERWLRARRDDGGGHVAISNLLRRAS